MAKATKWLQAILDYMKKVKSSTSSVHTHPPNGRGGANQRPRKMASAGLYIVWQVGGWAVQKLLNLLFNYKLAVSYENWPNTIDVLDFTFFI